VLCGNLHCETSREIVMDIMGQLTPSSQKRRLAAAGSFLSALYAGLVSAVKHRLAARFDARKLTEAQLRDAGIDPCEIERIRALRRPLIR
jgi:uncharacterized protein YjiS (DUF1127 family)